MNTVQAAAPGGRPVTALPTLLCVAGRMNSDVNCLACTVPPDLHAKRLLLVDLITLHSRAGKTIVFCNTKRECETVVSAVSAIMPAEALHGDIQQDMREYTMARFREVRSWKACGACRARCILLAGLPNPNNPNCREQLSGQSPGQCSVTSVPHFA